MKAEAILSHVSAHFAGWCWPLILTDSRRTRLQSYALLAASYLTDPICRVREIFWQLQIVKELEPTASKVERVKIKFFLCFEGIACGVAATFLTVPGIVIRSLLSYFQHEPYIHLKGTAQAETLLGNQLSLLSWNLANIAGGYSITDAGVAPWTYRIDAQVEAINRVNSDVLCLTELFDPSASFYLYQELKKTGYTDFYFNMGIKAIGLGAGLFIASKYAIHNPQFVPFPEATLQGRTKRACKGFFRFDIAPQKEVIARFYTTHMQHSEEPRFPNRNAEIKEITQEVIERALTEDCLDDVIARAAQMHLIVQDILKESSFNKPVILTGDLNLDDAEKENSLWKDLFSAGTLCYNKNRKKTWGGDHFYVGLVNGKTGHKKVSQPINLDHTLVYNNTRTFLETKLINSFYVGDQLVLDALSDHEGLASTITISNERTH